MRRLIIFISMSISILTNITEDKQQIEVPKHEISQENEIVTSSGIELSREDYNQLLHIVEAEAGNQDDIGKILVANVIFNRVLSDDFPDNVTDVIYEYSNGVYQFEPVLNGKIDTVDVTESTVECVNRAISGENYSEDALYFTMKTACDSWFNTSLSLLFVHGDHYFYTC